ncbi:glycosyltransferase family 2 protein [Seleniivibrio woodruffii]|uniref:glycosyltransferase family 2 protein n=1 Tax=Seleniivibrio woodruffii TaxID=1078050 RepID=UPI00240A86F9|nr:glycosyltransferase family 2 protein [Seleniivibrio woodruffii]
MDYKITVSIVYYDTDFNVFSETVNSLLNSSCVSRIYIVNNSGGEIPQYDDGGRIEIITPDRNIGFGAGHNLIIRDRYDILGDYHLICNPDVYFDGDVIRNLAVFMDSNPDAGLAVPKVLSVNGENQYAAKLLPTPADLAVRMFHQYLPDSFVERFNRLYELQDYSGDKSLRTGNLSGCFMFLRKSVLKKSGFFDERFFILMEDIDFSRRINTAAGSYYVPSVFIYHHRGRGSYKYFKQRMIHINSAIKYFNKWGWVFDSERKSVNRSLISVLGSS